MGRRESDTIDCSQTNKAFSLCLLCLTVSILQAYPIPPGSLIQDLWTTRWGYRCFHSCFYLCVCFKRTLSRVQLRKTGTCLDITHWLVFTCDSLVAGLDPHHRWLHGALPRGEPTAAL